MTRKRLLVLSDLHQGEGGRLIDPAASNRTFDAVVVAGDVAGRLTSSIEWLAAAFAGVDVVYVAGNHDFYRDEGPDGFTIEEEIAAGLELAERRGIRLLVDGETDLGGVRVLGSTLWTDLRAGMHHGLPQAIGEARRGMNDYKRIHRRSGTRRSRRIDPIYTARSHAASKAFLERAFSLGTQAPTVVVTHHAPSLRSLGGLHGHLDHCYASDLEAEIARWRPTLWVHGHIHAASDYYVGPTRILCNPLGRAEEETGFEYGKTVTIDVPEPGDP